MKFDDLRVGQEPRVGLDKTVFVTGSWAALRMLQVAIKQALELGRDGQVTVASGHIKIVVRNEASL